MSRASQKQAAGVVSIDALKSKTELMVKLVTQMRVEHDRLGALIEEFDNLLAGKASTGELLKGLYATWSELWESRHRSKYAWAMERDAPNMKKLLKLLGVDELEAKMVSYIKNEDPYYAERRHPFGLFVSSINSHRGLATRRFDDDAPVVSGCLHSPPCTSDQQHTKRRNLEMSEVRN